MMTKLLSPKESAERLGLTTAMVGRLIANGQIRAINVSLLPNSKRPTWKIAEVDLDEWLNSRATKPQMRADKQKPAKRKEAEPTKWF